jgi:uncharacterized protein YndB with AHSA1/START domain
MRKVEVVESIDIDAPRDEVFDLITNLYPRFQLSPLWGTFTITDVTPDYPQEGSHYQVTLTHDDGEAEEYQSIVTASVSNQEFAYRTTTQRQTQCTWTVRDTPDGTHLVCREEFLVDDGGDEEFLGSAREEVREWLKNIKRYAELRGGLSRRLLKWVMDRYILRLKVSQRRVIMMLPPWAGIGCVTFLMLAIAWGLAKLLGLM